MKQQSALDRTARAALPRVSDDVKLAARLRELADALEDGIVAGQWLVGSAPDLSAPVMREAAVLLDSETTAASPASATTPPIARHVRRLPGVEPRAETGPVKFGDDWTGVFIRGDEAFGLANDLLAGLDDGDGSTESSALRRELLRTTVRQLIALLLASDERGMSAGDPGASFAA